MRLAATPSAAVLLMLVSLPAAAADWQLSVYSGLQTAPHSTVSGTSQGVDFDFTAGWEGNSFAPPPYYGFRLTRWAGGRWGIGGEFTHAKAYADDDTLSDSGFQVLEFTDGNNILTANVLRRWQGAGRITPYAGGGIGVALPHVEVQASPSAPLTFEYQLAGPAARAFVGVELPLGDRAGLFAEYQITASRIDADLDGGGSLRTTLVTNALNLGLSFRF
jgi:lipid A oxidase